MEAYQLAPAAKVLPSARERGVPLLRATATLSGVLSPLSGLVPGRVSSEQDAATAAILARIIFRDSFIIILYCFLGTLAINYIHTLSLPLAVTQSVIVAVTLMPVFFKVRVYL